MSQFVKTIGGMQLSHVIHKVYIMRCILLTFAGQFLDAQRIHNLVTYLRELHSLGLANADYTTLLLTTYTKLKDVAHLDSFIKTQLSGCADRVL